MRKQIDHAALDGLCDYSHIDDPSIQNHVRTLVEAQLEFRSCESRNLVCPRACSVDYGFSFDRLHLSCNSVEVLNTGDRTFLREDVRDLTICSDVCTVVFCIEGLEHA